MNKNELENLRDDILSMIKYEMDLIEDKLSRIYDLENTLPEIEPETKTDLRIEKRICNRQLSTAWNIKSAISDKFRNAINNEHVKNIPSSFTNRDDSDILTIRTHSRSFIYQPYEWDKFMYIGQDEYALYSRLNKTVIFKQDDIESIKINNTKYNFNN